MAIFLTTYDIITFLERIFGRDVQVVGPDGVYPDTILKINDLGIHITCDINSGSYIDNLRMSDSGKGFGYFLYLDCTNGELHVENRFGVSTQIYTDYDKFDILEEIFNFLKTCNNSKLKAAIRDKQIDNLLK